MDSSKPSVLPMVWRWVGAALALACIVAILPHLPLPYSDRMPRLSGGVTRLCAALVGIGAALGSTIGTLAGLGWAVASGVITKEQHGLASIPLTSRVWLEDLNRWGLLVGVLTAAALPVWLLWMVGRLLSPSPRRPPDVLDLRRALRETLAWIWTHPTRYALMTAMGAVMWGADAALSGERTVEWGELALRISVTFGIGTVAAVLQYGIGLSLTDGRPRSLRETLGGVGRIVRFGMQRLIGGAIAVAGLLLLLVPGILWLAATQLAGVVVVAEGAGPLRALERSADLTRGVRWKLCAALVVPLVPIGIVGRLWGQGATRGLSLLLESFALLFLLACYAQLAGAAVGETAAANMGPKQAGGATRWRRLIADPALVVAAGWSLVLASVVATRVGSQLLYPEPSLLLLPPLDGARARIEAPLSEWCPYSLHARRRECEVATVGVSRGFAIDGYAFHGARCVPAPPEAWSSWRARLATHVGDSLAAALGSETVVRRPYRIGADKVDVAVLSDDAGAIVLALDVEDPSTDRARDARAARLAAAGVPNYWRLEVHKNRDPIMGDETLRLSSHPDAERGGYKSTRASNRNQDLLLRVATLPAARVAIDDVLPDPNHPCPPTGAWGAARHVAARRQPREVPAFVTDGSRPVPSLVFEDFDGDGSAHRLMFTAVSPPLADGFDPATSGLGVAIAGPFADSQLMNVVLPPGTRWIHVGGDASSWAYHDTTAEFGGITDLVVRKLEGTLSWELRGSGGSWPVSSSAIRNWGRLDLRLGGPGDVPESWLTASFLTGGWRPHCLEDPPGVITCRTPPPPEPCAVAGSDQLLRCTVEQLARAEEIFFASHGRYFSGACDDLPLIQIPAEMSCNITGGPSTFIVSAWHRRMTFRTGCVWESTAESSPIRCS